MSLSIRSIFQALIWVAMFGAFSQASLVQAQVKDTTHWNDEELYTDDAAAPAYFAVGVGGMVGYFKADLANLNANLALPFMRKSVSDGLTMMGGQVFVAVPWIKNLRVGGMLYGGKSQACCYDTVINTADSVNRFMEYSLNYGALTLDYVLPLHIKHFNIVPGVAVGYGSMNIYMRQAANRLSFDVARDFDLENAYTTHNYTASIFTYTPQVQFEYNPTGWMMLRLSAGYQGTSVGTWYADRDISVGSTKAFDGITGNGIVANFGVFFGLFQ